MDGLVLLCGVSSERTRTCDYLQIGRVLNLLRRRPKQILESDEMWVITRTWLTD